ncbi:MAG TPA: fructosamine kinase family protein [Acidimicrobiales bacterium]|nr:fructosamine kinase family protein [Acidimicrobiales bacterium]
MVERMGVASSETWLHRLADSLGPTDHLQRVGQSVWRVTAGGRRLVVKTGAGVADEAEGLRLLAQVDGAPSVPEVVLSDPDALVTEWVEPAEPTPAHHVALGRRLATLHSAPWSQWGGGSSWIGGCPVDPSVAPDATAFYGRRLLDLATRCGLERSVAPLVARLADIVPACRPALVHGDLWWGNVLWGTGDVAWLIDPSVHGGHPEEDLAMLGLFGAVPERVLSAYGEVRPLEDGWADRVEVFRLIPLLVHTVLFGGGYRQQAEAILRVF